MLHPTPRWQEVRGRGHRMEYGRTSNSGVAVHTVQYAVDGELFCSSFRRSNSALQHPVGGPMTRWLSNNGWDRDGGGGGQREVREAATICLCFLLSAFFLGGGAHTGSGSLVVAAFPTRPDTRAEPPVGPGPRPKGLSSAPH